MNITIISVGKIKEKYIKLGIEEFSKRLSRYCKLTMVEVPDEKTPDNASEREMELIKDKEGKQILNKIKDNMYVIAMDLQGDMKTSEQFAKQLSQLALSGDSNVAFIIGGSLGSYLAMIFFRHKTNHFKFKYGLPLMLILHCILFFILNNKIV